jgi:hypothetical protein
MALVFEVRNIAQFRKEQLPEEKLSFLKEYNGISIIWDDGWTVIDLEGYPYNLDSFSQSKKEFMAYYKKYGLKNSLYEN